MKKFTDFVGTEVNIGDKIFYSTTGRWPESRLCEVTRFTAKSMFAKILKTNRPYPSIDEEVVVKNDFVIVN